MFGAMELPERMVNVRSRKKASYAPPVPHPTRLPTPSTHTYKIDSSKNKALRNMYLYIDT